MERRCSVEYVLLFPSVRLRCLQTLRIKMSRSRTRKRCSQAATCLFTCTLCMELALKALLPRTHVFKYVAVFGKSSYGSHVKNFSKIAIYLTCMHLKNILKRSENRYHRFCLVVIFFFFFITFFPFLLTQHFISSSRFILFI